jgi:alpha-mannosidase
MITDKKILGKLKKIEARYTPYCFQVVDQLAVEYAETHEHFRTLPPTSAGLDWKSAESGTRWGGAWITGWFRSQVKLPSSCRRQQVFVRARTGGGESLFLVDSEHRGVFDGNHPVVMMAASGSTARIYEIAIEAHAGHPCIGTQPDDHNNSDFQCTFAGIDILLQRRDVTAFVFDLKVLLSLIDALDENNLRRSQVLARLADLYALIDAIPAETSEESWRPKLARARQLMRPLLEAKNGDTAPQMGIVGHSHIDTAWLWTLDETWRKCARTFSSILNLMEQYPEFLFLQSAPCHAEVVRREYPGIYKRIRKMVAEGRWEPNGGMWVEPDCNIPSGESFVRQFLLGQQATREMFGYTSDAFWQPDVFGYSAALPQIMRGCGVDFFLTTKIAWNDTTRFPYDTFWWKGIDGTAVLAHFNKIHCWPDPQTLNDQFQDLQNKDVEDRRLSAFGFGDGGGGPQYEMLEVARRVGDLEGAPRASYTTISDFMKSIRDERGDQLPDFVGELYLELHRGTLTSIAGVKKGNRKAEIALRDAEFLWSLAALQGRRYPAGKLRDLWKQLLVNQFHDILPGSSIPEVNDRAIAELGQCADGAHSLSADALQILGGRSPKKPTSLMIFNSLSWERTGELPLEGLPRGLTPADPGICHQRVSTVDGRDLLLVAGLDLPPLGAARLDLKRGGKTSGSSFKAGKNSLETPFARVRFDRSGRITSFIDKTSGRQLVRKGGLFNALWLGEDVPEAWDNWDIDFDQRVKMRAEDRLVKREVVADGPLQLRIRCTYQIGEGSHLVQDAIFHATSPRIDFETQVDWEEKHKLLKVGFATDLLADAARHEIQYGHVERPTHRNRPQDRAQFEVCNHKWTDLSENRLGVALLNDCKYGIGVDGGNMHLTLIKSGTHPDPRGDRGRHLFSYALLPHACGFSTEAVILPSYEFNVPPITQQVSADAPMLSSLLNVSAPNIVVEAIKWAEEGRALVLRLYEAERSGTHAEIRFGAPVKKVEETNMLEEQPTELPVKKGRTQLYFRPFEIKTLKITME